MLKAHGRDGDIECGAFSVKIQHLVAPVLQYTNELYIRCVTIVVNVTVITVSMYVASMPYK